MAEMTFTWILSDLRGKMKTRASVPEVPVVKKNLGVLENAEVKEWKNMDAVEVDIERTLGELIASNIFFYNSA